MVMARNFVSLYVITIIVVYITLHPRILVQEVFLFPVIVGNAFFEPYQNIIKINRAIILVEKDKNQLQKIFNIFPCPYFPKEA